MRVLSSIFHSLSLFFFFCSAMWLAGILVPQSGTEPWPWQWKCWVLTTGPPGKSLWVPFLFNIYSQNFCLFSRVECHRKWFPFKRSYLSALVITKDDRNLIDGWKSPMKFVLSMDMEQGCVPTSPCLSAAYAHMSWSPLPIVRELGIRHLFNS